MAGEWMRMIARERPVGTNVNTEINDYLEQQFGVRYFIKRRPMVCTLWSANQSFTCSMI